MLPGRSETGLAAATPCRLQLLCSVWELGLANYLVTVTVYAKLYLPSKHWFDRSPGSFEALYIYNFL